MPGEVGSLDGARCLKDFFSYHGDGGSLEIGGRLRKYAEHGCVDSRSRSVLMDVSGKLAVGPWIDRVACGFRV